MRWEDPPVSIGKSRGRGRAWSTEAAELRANPGKWGILAEYPVDRAPAAASLAWSVRQGILSSFRPPGAFEVATRRSREETPVVVRVYVRYNPKAEQGPELSPRGES